MIKETENLTETTHKSVALIALLYVTCYGVIIMDAPDFDLFFEQIKDNRMKLNDFVCEGDRWYLRLPKASALVHMIVTKKTSQTVTLRDAKSRSLESIYKLTDIEFIEKTNIENSDELKHCAFDRDECTVTIAFDNEHQVNNFIESHESRNRIRVVSDV